MKIHSLSPPLYAGVRMDEDLQFTNTASKYRKIVYLTMEVHGKSRDTSTPCLHATWEATVDI